MLAFTTSSTSHKTKKTTDPKWLQSVCFNQDGLIPAVAQDHQSGEILMMAWMNAESLQLTVQSKTAVYFSRSRGKLWHKGETSGHTQQVHDIYLDCDADVVILSVTQIGDIACHTGRQSCFYRRLDTSNDTPSWQTISPVLKDPDIIYGNQTDFTHTPQQDNQPKNQSIDNIDKQSNTTVVNSNNASTSTVATSAQILIALDEILQARKTANADSSYVASLYHKGINKILEKVGEEAVEAIIAAKDLASSLQDNFQNNLQDNSQNSLQNNSLNNVNHDNAQYELIYEVADVWFHTLVTLAWFNISSEQILNELARRFGLSGLEEKAQRTQ